MDIVTLRNKLQASIGGTFKLLAADLAGLAGAEALLNKYLGGVLTITDARPNVQELTVDGIGTVDTIKDVPVRVRFSADHKKGIINGLLLLTRLLVGL